jgi:hypothetical protein
MMLLYVTSITRQLARGLVFQIRVSNFLQVLSIAKMLPIEGVTDPDT